MADIIAQIQKMAIDSHVPLSDLLRRCLVLSYKIHLDDFSKWARFELDGYPVDEEIPQYRTEGAIYLATYTNGFYTYKNQPLPLIRLPEYLRKRLLVFKLLSPIKAVEDLAEKTNKESEGLYLQVDPDIVSLVDQEIKITETYKVENIVQCVSESFIVGVLESVRNKVLDFILRIQEMGVRMEGDTVKGSNEVEERIKQEFHLTVYGDRNNFASGNFDDSPLTFSSNVESNDLESLVGCLKKMGVPENEIEALQKAIQQDQLDHEKEKGIGKRVKAWVGELSSKVFSKSITAIAVDNVPQIMAAVQKYFN